MLFRSHTKSSFPTAMSVTIPKHGVTVKDVAAPAFVAAYARYLKRSGKVTLPKWVDIVKTGAFKELAPYDADWFYIRCASIARNLYIRGSHGVGSLKIRYGGQGRRGVLPNHGAEASGSVIRAAFKALEKLRVLEKDPNGGRRVSRTGQRDLDRIAGLVAGHTRPVRTPRK